jgi:peroxiredoxin Q/BCP
MRLRTWALAAFGFGAAFAADGAGGAAGKVQAPSFELRGSDGAIHRLSDHAGKRAVVLAWFPKAFTGGCTAECKSLRESGAAIREFEVALYAASCDDAETNRKFAASLDLDYPILSDPGCAIARAYGVATEGSSYAQRVTFYIGPDGTILDVDRSVKASTAGNDIAERLTALEVKRK